MAHPLSILVSGAGVAGSVFASCLLRAYPDATVTIIERTPSLRLTGASVDIRGTAVDIIKEMGVEPRIRAASTREQGCQYVTAKGYPISTILASGRTDIQVRHFSSVDSAHSVERHRGSIRRRATTAMTATEIGQFIPSRE
jgi:2-polyprenyl-6-methoxyphenol hydroxylase-like FAD-dependent oxidoreductase